ncbi:MAG: Ni/Fe hydrogenase subunit alpha [Planctomycetes bacterium]|nr:Ni/Fe hydrogenase subunit alpha [Planctomycetota bacterium]
MSQVRRFEVKSLARVEGEGSLRVRVADGRVEIAEFSIYEPPRFFEKLLRGRAIGEVPDMVARICGICPVAYQLTACAALEHALGVMVTPEITRLRRLLYHGEWVQSHGLHVHLLHAPDFFGVESGIALAASRPDLVSRGLRLKELGRRIMEVVGGRAVHPINVAVGGFHKAPQAAAIRGLVPDLEWALTAALDLIGEVRGFGFPGQPRDYDGVCLRSEEGYPLDEGRIVSTSGLDIDIAEYELHFAERQVPWSTALHAVMLPGETPYLVGPLARMNRCHDRLPSQTRQAVEACRIEFPFRLSAQSIVARAIEIAVACEGALAIARDAAADVTPCRVAWEPRAGIGSHATEAPRGLLWHRYEIGDDGLVRHAAIVPPTSQNQAMIEADLKAMLPAVLDRDDAAATFACERLIRDYDPCISCATHFLRLRIDRGA